MSRSSLINQVRLQLMFWLIIFDLLLVMLSELDEGDHDFAMKKSKSPIKYEP
jgi:hypothetical protein